MIWITVRATEGRSVLILSKSLCNHPVRRHWILSGCKAPQPTARWGPSRPTRPSATPPRHQHRPQTAESAAWAPRQTAGPERHPVTAPPPPALQTRSSSRDGGRSVGPEDGLASCPVAGRPEFTLRRAARCQRAGTVRRPPPRMERGGAKTDRARLHQHRASSPAPPRTGPLATITCVRPLPLRPSPPARTRSASGPVLRRSAARRGPCGGTHHPLDDGTPSVAVVEFPGQPPAGRPAGHPGGGGHTP